VISSSGTCTVRCRQAGIVACVIMCPASRVLTLESGLCSS
jgi:hypothetical protein